MNKQKPSNSLRFIVISLLLLSLSNKSLAQSELKVTIDEIIAKVDDYIVLKSDLEKAHLEYLSRGEFRTSNAKCEILQQLVQEKMFLAKAVIDSVEVEDALVEAQVTSRMDAVIARVGSPEELEKYYGKTLEQIEEELFDDVKAQMIVQKMRGEITSGLKVSPAEVKRFFKKIPNDSLPYFSTEVEVAQIIKIPKPGKQQKEAVRKQLFEIRGRIIAGESFATLAREYSEDPGSAANGGQLPFYSRGQLAPEFEATAMTLSAGELSDPVETQFGFHLIELQERRGNTFRCRHILIQPQPSLSDVQQAEDFLDSLRKEILVDSISFQQAAKDFSDDKGANSITNTAANGGFFSDPSGSTKVSVEQLDPNIFFTLDTMKLGAMSLPEKYQMADGADAFRILYYKSKTPPHQANLKQDYQKIADAALNNKRAIKINDYFQEARESVYIEVDGEYDYCNLVER